MALRPFSFPSPETRFFTADSLIYKFKIRGGNSFSEDEVLQEGSFDNEIEEIIRAVLGNLDYLQPFTTQHFIVFPYKKSWGKVCKHDAKKLSFYPFAIILYLEKNTFRENQSEKIFSDEPRPKRSRGDSPLEDAIIKRLMKDMEAEGSKSVSGTVDLAMQDSATTEEPQTTQFRAEKGTTPEKPGILKRLIRKVFPFVFRPDED